MPKSLHKGLKEKNIDIIKEKNIDLSKILDNIWNDRKVMKKIKGVKYGIPISTAVIGTVAAGPIGGLGGFLTGLMVNLANELISTNQQSIVKSIANFQTKDYLINIFDFKNKYDLNKK